MSASSRKSITHPAISRQYDFSRLQDQTLASAYEALVPVVSRRTARDSHPRDQRVVVTSTHRSSHRTVAGA
jgi:hypothetical protein